MQNRMRRREEPEDPFVRFVSLPPLQDLPFSNDLFGGLREDLSVRFRQKSGNGYSGILKELCIYC
jgi:hypothetical protein